MWLILLRFGILWNLFFVVALISVEFAFIIRILKYKTSIIVYIILDC